LRDTILGVAAAGDQRHYLVAKLVLAGSLAKRDHFAGDLKAGQIAGSRRRRINAGTLSHVRPVDAGSHHLDQDFIRPRHRHGPRLG